VTHTFATAGVAAAIAVTLQNLKTGNPSTFHIGESWQLTITGPPNKAVYIHAMQNGADLGSSFLGTTNASGTLNVFGTMSSDAQLGSWVETYTVGGVQWSNQLTFSVLP